MSPEVAHVFEQAEQLAQQAGDNFVTVERLLVALAAAAGTGAAKAIAAARVSAQSLNRAIEEVPRAARPTPPRLKRAMMRSRNTPAI
jgi:ATP-dependent Clp protease ATP-binding subunit ClpB